MAEKISVQIALEGGAEVERQLQGIGEAGQKAFADISKAAEQTGGFKNLDPSVATEKLKQFGVTGVGEIQKVQKALSTAVRFEKLVTGVESVETVLVSLGRAAGVVGVAVAAAFVAMAKPTIAFAAALNKASDQAVKLGQSLEQFKQFQQDFQKLGVSGDAAAAGFAKFQKELQKAAQADPGSNLALFGQNAAAMQEQLQRTLATIRQMPDGLQRTQAAIDALDTAAGVQFVQGLRAAEGSMTADERKAYDLGQALQGLKTAWDQFGSLAFAPGLTAGINAATTAVQALTTAFNGLQQIGQSDLGQKIGGTLQNAFTGLDQIIARVAAGIAQGVGASAQQVQTLQQAILGTGQAAQQAGQQAGQGFQIWNEELGKAVPAAQAVTTAVQGTSSAISALVSQLGSITWDAISSAGVAAWNAITGAIQAAIDAVLKFIGLKPSAPATGGSAPGAARGGLIGGRGSGTSDSNLAWLSRGEFVMRAAAVRQFGAGFFAALNGGRIPALRRSGGIPGFAGGGFMDVFLTPGLMSQGDSPVSQINAMAADVNLLLSMVGGLPRFIDEANQKCEQHSDQNLEKSRQYLDEFITTGVMSHSAAGGGLIGGRGSGTSDSNLAWLSRGEFVINAAMVRRFGAGFFAALNAGMMPGFALGGLVPRPAFASGGPVGGGNHVTIQFPGVPPVGGLRASTAVVEQLQKAAALAQVRSGGRKPSRYS